MNSRDNTPILIAHEVAKPAVVGPISGWNTRKCHIQLDAMINGVSVDWIIFHHIEEARWEWFINECSSDTIHNEQATSMMYFWEIAGRKVFMFGGTPSYAIELHNCIDAFRNVLAITRKYHAAH